MTEEALLKLWNENRVQLILAQVAPALVLIAIFVLAAQGTFASASDASRYLAIAVAAVTGLLAMVSQFAVIREANALIVDLDKIENSTEVAKRIAASKSFLSLSAAIVLGLGLLIFVFIVWSVLG